MTARASGDKRPWRVTLHPELRPFPLPGEPGPPECGWCGGLREIVRVWGVEPCPKCGSDKADAAAEGDRGA